MPEIRHRVLTAAREQFLRFGFTKVTTDELTSQLGMSKKTLYKYFPSKEILLEEVIHLTTEEISQGAEQILHNQDLDFVQKLQQLMAFLGEQISKIFSPRFVRDIQINAPQIWEKVETFREQQVQTKFASLIEEGIRKGIFRNDINQDLLVLVYFNAIQTIIHPEVLANLPFTASQVFEAIIKIIFEGIFTDEARTKFKSKDGRTYG